MWIAHSRHIRHSASVSRQSFAAAATPFVKQRTCAVAGSARSFLSITSSRVRNSCFEMTASLPSGLTSAPALLATAATAVAVSAAARSALLPLCTSRTPHIKTAGRVLCHYKYNSVISMTFRYECCDMPCWRIDANVCSYHVNNERELRSVLTVHPVAHVSATHVHVYVRSIFTSDKDGPSTILCRTYAMRHTGHGL